MAIGDAAAAAGMNIVDGATTEARTIDDEINRTRDYIATGAGATTGNNANKVVKRDPDGRVRFSTGIEADQGATKWYVDQAEAAAKAHTDDAVADYLPLTDVIVSTSGASVANKVPRYDGIGRLVCASPAAANQAAPKAYVDNAIAGVSADANQVTSAAYAREVGASRYAMWMDGGRWIGRSSSTRRHKNDIAPHNFDVPALLGIPVVSFIRDVDTETETRDIGLIAEDLHDAGLVDLVDYDDEGTVEGIRDHRLVYALLATVQQLAARIDELENRT